MSSTGNRWATGGDSGRSLYLGIDEADGRPGPHVSLEAFGGSGVEAKNCIVGI